MEPPILYELPKLNYDYNALEPVISQELLTLHHDKHHAAYVNGANAILQKLDKARTENLDMDMKATLKELSFHIGGHVLHSRFWKCMAPQGRGGGGVPTGLIGNKIVEEYGSFERFKKMFSATAASVEGSGWASLAFCKKTKRPLIMQIEKHSNNVYPTFKNLLVCDVWEHAYYLDYKNDRGKFIEAWWSIVNWQEVNDLLEVILSK
jgi:Fe-Mn family superoxide dismutase